MSREIEERNIQFIQSLFAATGSGDWETAHTMVTEDFCVIEADSLPFGGIFRGIAGLQQLYALVMSSIGVTSIDMTQLTAGGDRVVALAELQLGGWPPVRIPLAETFRFRDGKVCEIKPYYFDPAPIWDAFNAIKRASVDAR